MNRRLLLPLLTALFAVVTASLLVVGALPAIAAGLHVSEATAGQLMMAYAITSAIGSPLLSGLASRFDRRKLLITVSVAFMVINLATALAPTFPVALGLRVLAAICASILLPLMLTLAAELAEPEHRGRALGTMVSGMTAAMVVGAPVGTLLAELVHWRSAFLLVAILSLIGNIALVRYLPPVPRGEHLPLRERLAPLGQASVLLGLIGSVIAQAGGMMVFAFLAPILRTAGHISGPWMTAVIAITGLAGVAGTNLGGRLIDRIGAQRTLLLITAVNVVMMAVFATLTKVTAPAWLAVPVVALWGGALWAFNPPIQARLLELAPHAATEVLALNTSAMYGGQAVGAGLGGYLFGVLGVVALPLAGTVMLIVALALLSRVRDQEILVPVPA
ncbi:MFS transporter [Pseudonocardiaceae bacterium YIM PH 21723]|nr:MFS transporter [Pseudonocardiaceae bacterium YIM PH 21723]